MKRKNIGIGIGALLGVLMLVLGGIYYYVQTDAFMQKVEQTASSAASDSLGVPVEIGSVTVVSNHEIEIQDLAIYDKQAECIARANKARVDFRLFSAFQDPSHAVKEVTLSGVQGNLRQREDGTWNVEDIQTKSSTSGSFYGLVRLEDSEVTASMQGKTATVSQLSGTLDFSAYPVLQFQVNGESFGAPVKASGSYRKENQILQAETEGLDIAQVLPLLPDGLLPSELSIEGGTIVKAKISGQKMGSQLSFTGQAEYKDVAVRVKDTEVEDIHGFTSFNDTEMLVLADARANGQSARVHGSVRLDTDSPYLDLTVSSDGFDPAQVLRNIPYEGAAAFTAHVTGTAKDPVVDGRISLPPRLAVQSRVKWNCPRMIFRIRRICRPAMPMCSRPPLMCRSCQTCRGAFLSISARPVWGRMSRLSRSMAVLRCRRGRTRLCQLKISTPRSMRRGRM